MRLSRVEKSSLNGKPALDVTRPEKAVSTFSHDAVSRQISPITMGKTKA
jgi:hypothetical protein